MAINEKLLTLEGMAEVVESGYKAYEQLSNLSAKENEKELINQTINKLKSYYNSIKKTERKILRAFGIETSDIETGKQELQKKFLDFYQSSGLTSFSGEELRERVLNYYRAIMEKKDRELSAFLNGPFLNRIIQETGEDLSNEENIRNIILKVFTQFNGDVKTNTGGTRVIYSYNKKSNKGFINIQDLSLNRKNIANLIKETGKFKINEKDIVVENKQNNEYQITSEIIIDYGASGYTTLSEEEFNKLDMSEKKKMRDILQQEISKIFKGNSESIEEYKFFLSELITIENLKNFLAGKNVNNVTGILGEISAYIALKKLISNQYKDQIRWIANEEKDNKKLSIDFIINKLNIGIQIKNTSLNLDNLKENENKIKGLKIDFADADINTIFERLQSMGLNIDIETIKDVYTSSSFNIPYTYETIKGGRTIYKKADLSRNPYNTKSKNPNTINFIKYKNHGFNSFVGTYEAEKALIEKINIFFASFAPQFLFMGIKNTNYKNTLINLTNEVEKISNGNNLYLIAGHPVFASTILQRIINDLEESEKLLHFQLEASLGKTAKDFFEDKKERVTTIVDYKNSNFSDEQKITFLRNTGVKFTGSFIFDNF